MKRRLFAAILALILLFSMPTGVFAYPTDEPLYPPPPRSITVPCLPCEAGCCEEPTAIARGWARRWANRPRPNSRAFTTVCINVPNIACCARGRR